MQGNFPDYEMIGMSAYPEIDANIFTPRKALVGLGRPAIPTIDAAVTSSIFILTGQRIRTLLIKSHDFPDSSPLAGV